MPGASANCALPWRAASRLRLLEARARAEELLLKDRHGRRCAERLCQTQDEIIRILFEFVVSALYPPQIHSQAERMAVIATGGYGRGLLAPGSDIDLLFVLPYKQTAWGESVAEALLYCLWDMGQKVGHATRSVDECIRQAKADMTIRTALLEVAPSARRPLALWRIDRALRQRGGAGHRGRFVAAKLAEREERHRRAGHSRYLVEPNVKDGKGGLRDLHTLFWIAKYVYRVREPEELIDRGVFDRARISACSAAARTSSGRSAATCTSSPAAPRSGCPSTFSARSRCGSATPSIRGCRTSSAS